MGDAYFLAEGNREQLVSAIQALAPAHGYPVFGVKGGKLNPISDVPVPPDVAAIIPRVPRAPSVP
jgi:hypothetical protein